MLFYTYIFVFWFLPCCIGSYYLLVRFGRPHLAFLSLILFSLLFYGWWNPHYLWILIASICSNYLLGRLLILTQGKNPFFAQALFAIGVMGNLAVLTHYKYSCLLGEGISCSSVVLPLAISFFTFQQIEYLLDAWKGRIGRHGFVNYFLFVVFFPHLIAGPITRHNEMMPQFELPSSRTLENLSIGITIFTIGLVKKVFLADSLAPFTTAFFESAASGHPVALLPAWMAAIGFTVQLYFDFSGYSDMAIGISRMFGIKLPLNFNSPFQSRNIAEFWQRWHLTLTRYVKAHIYIPLGGNRCGKLRHYLNLMIAMLLVGVWHGAGSQFAIFGVMHGCLLVGYQIFRDFSQRWQWVESMRRLLPNGLCVAVTFFFVAVSFVFFKAASIGAAVAILKGMVGFASVLDFSSLGEHQGGLQSLALRLGQEDLRVVVIHLTYGYSELLIFPICLAIVWLAPNTQQIMERYMNDLVAKSEPEGSAPVQYVVPFVRGGLNRLLVWQPTRMMAVVVAILMVSALMKANYRSAIFLYFQF